MSRRAIVHGIYLDRDYLRRAVPPLKLVFVLLSEYVFYVEVTRLGTGLIRSEIFCSVNGWETGSEVGAWIERESAEIFEPSLCFWRIYFFEIPPARLSELDCDDRENIL